MYNLVLADTVRPKSETFVYNTVLVLAGSLFIAISAQIAFALPFSPVPVTMQTFAVLMTGAILGPKRGAIAVLAYLAEGFCGLPVFSFGRSGLHMLFGPTGGYLLGFVFAAYIAGFFATKKWDRNVLTTTALMTVATGVIFAFGLLWLTVMLGGFRPALVAGFYPFIPGAVFKIGLASLVLPAGWKAMKRFKAD